MKKFIYLCGIMVLFLLACNSNFNMTTAERKLINSADAETPFRVLQVTNTEDSLFLRQKCIDVDIKNISEDKDIQLFIQRLKVTLDVEEGVGIAAPQVGIGRNIFLFLRVTEPDMPVQVVINPKIVDHSEETVCFERDGCLSIPDISGNSVRYAWVEVEYFDETGRQIREKLTGFSRETGFTGVIFQHEYDHLQGVLFIDKLCNL